MRDYGKISPQFWTGETGRAIRAAGRDSQVIAFYLLTCPSANMIGLYYLPLPTLCHEVGITPQGASKALASLSEALFVRWNATFEHVFVVEMAAHQIGQSLSPTDNRVKGIIKDWQAMRKSPFYIDFHARYSADFHLPEPKPLISPLEGPPKPGAGTGAGTGDSLGRKRRESFEPPSLEEVEAYCRERHNDIDPQAFIAFYASKDWLVGKNKMADWRQAVVTWERKRAAEPRKETLDELYPLKNGVPRK